jgi:hypothetical protein
LQDAAIPVSEPVSDGLLTPVFEVMDQPLHGPSRFKIEQGGRFHHGTLAVKKAIGGAVGFKVGIGEGQFISTKCAQDALSPI